MRPFLQAAGFAADKTTFIPVAAMAGVNLANGGNPQLKAWYKGPTLVEVLGMNLRLAFWMWTDLLLFTRQSGGPRPTARIAITVPDI